MFSTLLLATLVAADPTPMPLWGDKIPGPTGSDPANIPTLAAHLAPADKATGTAVVVCPGGGYSGRAVDHEGKQIADWLNARGVHAFILKYRTANESKVKPPIEPGPMLDVQRAVRTVRAKAKDWGVDPKRVGVWGFSAGGHLASTAATHFDAGDAKAADAIDRTSSRPDFAILAYPVISMKEGVTHNGSRNNLIGPKADAKLVEFYSNELHVTKDTPPTFLFHTVEDKAVLLENSKLFEAALKKAGVEGCKLYVEQTGPHGIGLGQKLKEPSKWPAELEAWLKERGLLERK
ncbi:MAG TPA: alpha/beta hydrolase [Gemmataceae bacterium]|jgi:acetyl esterase/lipase|nr:alpha/beta hydrolase [Gemmataceae bacterium]